MQNYGDVLAEGEKLSEDHEYQMQLLKKNFGYTERDETPILIIPGDK